MSDSDILFSEKQKFTQLWLRLLLIGLALISLLAIVAIIVTAKNILSLIWLLTVLPAILPIWLVASAYLTTEVKQNGIHVRLFPFKGRHIAFEDVKEAYVRTYKPILEYGGWGLRYGRSGKAFNVKGNEGVQLVLNKDEKLLIGSQRAKELEEILSKFIKT